MSARLAQPRGGARPVLSTLLVSVVSIGCVVFGCVQLIVAFAAAAFLLIGSRIGPFGLLLALAGFGIGFTMVALGIILHKLDELLVRVRELERR